MTPGRLSRRVIVDRLSWIERMLGEIRSLPQGSLDEFLADRRNVWAAESCLRRSLEAIFDLGRHILAKGFGLGVSDYKEIAARLGEQGVLLPEEVSLLRVLAGYRNRLVHFYHEVEMQELYAVCTDQLADLERITEAYRRWLKEHEEWLNETL